MEISKIKTARIEAGFSQADITHLIGIPINTLSQWERGIRKTPEWVENLVVAEIKRIEANKDKKET